VKNNLQMLGNMLNIQAARQEEGEVKAALDSTKSRIDAISTLHRLLYRDEEVSTVLMTDYVQPLVDQLLDTSGYDDSEVRIQAHIAPIRIDVDRAIPLAIILNEWLTNAFKYAVPLTPDPEIQIELKALGDERMMLVVADNGPGLDPAHRRQGSYGTDLVNSMVRQLNAHLELDTQQGTRYSLAFRNPKKI
jgi:two-component sensor histidine kinase